MKQRGSRSILIALVVWLASGAAPARAAEEALLVVVEAPPPLDLDAAEIRRVVGAELHERTVAPALPGSDAPERALIVAVDRDRITMSLRQRAATPVIRSIPLPADRAARLRAIAWLAGNLARDQVSAIVAAPEPPASAVEPAPALPELPVPAASSASTLEPPRFEAPAATATAHLDPASPRAARWTVGVSAGPAASLYETVHVFRQSMFGSWNLGSAFPDIYRDGGTVWRVDVRRRTEGSRVFTGLALEGGTTLFVRETLGALALAGGALQLGRWSLEANLGAGIDVIEEPSPVYSDTQLSAGSTETTLQSVPVSRVGLFAAGSLAVAHPVFAAFDGVLAIDGHQSVVNQMDGYLAATLGLRYRL